MTEIFKHLFGGWHEAEACRWANKDGTPGGIVAVTATVDPDVIIAESVVVWPNARIGARTSIGHSTSIGDGTSIEADDWLFVAGPQGSRNSFATATNSATHGLRWWVGCQHGITTETFRARIDLDHPAPSEHRDNYLALIAFVEAHPGLARHRAKIAAASTNVEG